ncbi:zinc ribbon domain-containing protein [Haloferax namakaokahaiae]|uniref:Zinc ribbon domain-containing protein n=1 Tax=Haloferax namakaokahaiae TaxID=1748331 RepID=A0ABD5ZA05_9EURY
MSVLSKLPPWLVAVVAALLGLLVTGLGHLFLWRWRRALLWILLAFTVALVFVPTSALEAVSNGAAMSPAEFRPVLVELLPVLVVSLVSVADAFILGWKKASSAPTVTDEPDGETHTCPQCGNEIDPELDFCHWCTTRLAPADGDGS